jgi:hypothetical protein
MRNEGGSRKENIESAEQKVTDQSRGAGKRLDFERNQAFFVTVNAHFHRVFFTDAEGTFRPAGKDPPQDLQEHSGAAAAPGLKRHGFRCPQLIVAG